MENIYIELHQHTDQIIDRLGKVNYHHLYNNNILLTLIDHTQTVDENTVKLSAFLDRIGGNVTIFVLENNQFEHQVMNELAKKYFVIFLDSSLHFEQLYFKVATYIENPVKQAITNRTSLRIYDPKPIEEHHLKQLLEAAKQAPSAGNMMMYSMIVIKDQQTLDKLAVSCDNQPFIARAKVVIIFVADFYKWHTYYGASNILSWAAENNTGYKTPSISEFILANQDAIIAAQNMVTMAESLNIGTCYIGDIMEHVEYHQELLNLSDYCFPVGMLTLGYYPKNHKRNKPNRFNDEYMIFNEQYHQLTENEVRAMMSHLRFNENNKYGAKNHGQMHYAFKIGSEFAREMERSIKKAMQPWLNNKMMYLEDLYIQPACLDDIDAIMNITTQVVRIMNADNNYQWSDHYPLADDFIKDINAKELYLFKQDNQIKGYICINKDIPQEYYQLDNIPQEAVVVHRLAVDPAYQNQGIASQLLDYAINQSNKQHLELLTDTNSVNKKMNALFIKKNFELQGSITLEVSSGLFNVYQLKKLG